MSDFGQFLTSSLQKIEQAGLKRTLRNLTSPQGPVVECDGRQLVNFSSNDYLGLADDPRLAAAAHSALDVSGWGAGASRLVCGNHTLHEALETALARFKRTESALSFSNGYAAAVGTIPAVVGEGDVVILDKLCHACLVDGARLSGAHIRVFPHNHLEKMDSHLRWAREKHPEARVLVLVESVYSMDGDRAPLAEIVALKEKYGAWLMVDEAHGVGVIGDSGRGLAEQLGLSARIEIQMGTLGKALGSSGAYICGHAALRDYLINRARSFIFSTAPPPSVAAASLAAVELLEAEGEDLLTRLWLNLDTYTKLMDQPEATSAIFPLILHAEDRAMEASRALGEQGYLVAAIRYPTVARGAARLRTVVTAAHTFDQIKQLTSALRTFRPLDS